MCDSADLGVVQVSDHPPGQVQSVVIVDGIVVGHSGSGAVKVGSTKLFGGDLLASCGFHQRWTTQKYSA